MSEKRSIVFSAIFPRILKELRKKYRHIEDDVDDFANRLENGETIGDRLQGTGDYIVYKARVASRDMQRGKSGGFRAIYYLKTESHIIVLTLYAKTERVDIPLNEILELIKDALDDEPDNVSDGE